MSWNATRRDNSSNAFDNSLFKFQIRARTKRQTHEGWKEIRRRAGRRCIKIAECFGMYEATWILMTPLPPEFFNTWTCSLCVSWILLVSTGKRWEHWAARLFDRRLKREPFATKKHSPAKWFSFMISASVTALPPCLCLAPHPIAFYFFPSLIFSHRSYNLRSVAASHTYAFTSQIYRAYACNMLGLCERHYAVSVPGTCTRACILRETMGVPTSRDGHARWAPLKRALGSWRSFIPVCLFRGGHWWPYAAFRKVKENWTTEMGRNRRSIAVLNGFRESCRCVHQLCVVVTVFFARQPQPLCDRSAQSGQEHETDANLLLK